MVFDLKNSGMTNVYRPLRQGAHTSRLILEEVVRKVLRINISRPRRPNMNNATETYDDVEREWNRLVRDAYHSLEFLVTMHHIRKHFPPGGKILDAGGGPGRYSIELCRAGYNVVLFDLSPKCIATAKDKFKSEPEAVQNRLLEFVLGDIRDLSRFETNHFDAVLCLGGPLTHISD
jgi:ubiquinone/menaquinone biosynthesis C-methylase UbiE